MLLRALRESRKVISNLGRSITERVYLKTTTLDRGYNPRFASQIAHHLNAFIRDDKCNQLIIDGGVLHQRPIISESRLKLSDRKEMLVLTCLLAVSGTMLELTRYL